MSGPTPTRHTTASIENQNGYMNGICKTMFLAKEPCFFLCILVMACIMSNQVTRLASSSVNYESNHFGLFLAIEWETIILSNRQHWGDSGDSRSVSNLRSILSLQWISIGWYNRGPVHPVHSQPKQNFARRNWQGSSNAMTNYWKSSDSVLMLPRKGWG